MLSLRTLIIKRSRVGTGYIPSAKFIRQKYLVRVLDENLNTAIGTLSKAKDVSKVTRSALTDALDKWFPRFSRNDPRWYQGVRSQHGESHALAQVIDGLNANNISLDPDLQGLRMITNRPPCISDYLNIFPERNRIGTGQIQNGLKEIQNLPGGQHIQYIEIHMPLGVYTNSNYELEQLNSSLIRIYSDRMEVYKAGRWHEAIIENGKVILQ